MAFIQNICIVGTIPALFYYPVCSPGAVSKCLIQSVLVSDNCSQLGAITIPALFAPKHVSRHSQTSTLQANIQINDKHQHRPLKHGLSAQYNTYISKYISEPVGLNLDEPHHLKYHD